MYCVDGGEVAMKLKVAAELEQRHPQLDSETGFCQRTTIDHLPLGALPESDDHTVRK